MTEYFIKPPSIDINELTLLTIKVNMMRRELSERIMRIAEKSTDDETKASLYDLVDYTDEDTLGQCLDHFCRKSVLAFYPEVLAEAHYGDCTGQACMCDRCYFERLAEKETVNWGKQSGSTELARYLNDKKETI